MMLKNQDRLNHLCFQILKYLQATQQLMQIFQRNCCMKLKDYIIDLITNYDFETEIKFGLNNDELCEPDIEPTEDTDTGEYYYRIVGE